MTELQEAFEKASIEPYGFQNHLPELWKLKEGEQDLEWERRKYLQDKLQKAWWKMSNLLGKINVK